MSRQVHLAEISVVADFLRDFRDGLFLKGKAEDSRIVRVALGLEGILELGQRHSGAGFLARICGCVLVSRLWNDRRAQHKA